MSVIVPNADDTAPGNKYVALDQSEPDALDFEILSVRGSGVLTGCAVTSNNFPTTVNVGGGTVVLNGVSYPVTANPTFTLPTAPADSRFDLIVARISAGTATITALSGANSATNPTFPKSVSVLTGASASGNFNPDTDVALAAVFRTGSTTVTSGRIADKRVMLTSTIPNQGSTTPANNFGTTGSLYFKTGAPTGSASNIFVQGSDGVAYPVARDFGPHVPIGGIIMWPGRGAIPDGFLECNGQVLNVATYPALASVLGSLYGGDGTTTFGLPSMAGRYTRQPPLTSFTGLTFGTDSVQVTTAHLPAHSHGMTHYHDFTHTHGIDHDHPAQSTFTESGHTHDFTHTHTVGVRNVVGSFTTNGGTGYTIQGGPLVASAGATSGATSAPSPDATTGGGSAHNHIVDLAPYAGSTSSLSTSSTSGIIRPIAGDSNTDVAGLESPSLLSVVPASIYMRHIIRAFFGTDNSFTGGATNYVQAQTVVTKSTGDVTLVPSDVGALVIVSKATAGTITVNSALGLAPGQRIEVLTTGAGLMTFTASGTTLNTAVATNGLRLRAQYSRATLICTAVNTYLVTGDLG